MKKLKEVLLSEKISKLSKERDKTIKSFNGRINELKLKLESICTHSETEMREENYEGGYLNVAEYNKITNCKLCGRELKRVTTTGGYA